MDSCSASGVHFFAWGAFTTFPYKFGPQIFFLPPGGALAPSAPHGYTYAFNHLRPPHPLKI